MAVFVEVIVDVRMDGGELLERLHLSKSQHGSLPSSEWKMAILNPVVEPSPHFLPIQIAKLAHRCRV